MNSLSYLMRRAFLSHAGNLLRGHPDLVVLNHDCMLESLEDKAEKYCPRTVILKLGHANKLLVKRQNLTQQVQSGARHPAFLTNFQGMPTLLVSAPTQYGNRYHQHQHPQEAC